MDRLMTMEEIEKRFDGEWVLLADIESDPGPVVRRARVVWHGADQDEAWARAADVTSPSIGVYFIGETCSTSQAEEAIVTRLLVPGGFWSMPPELEAAVEHPGAGRSIRGAEQA